MMRALTPLPLAPLTAMPKPVLSSGRSGTKRSISKVRISVSPFSSGSVSSTSRPFRRSMSATRAATASSSSVRSEPAI